MGTPDYNRQRYRAPGLSGGELATADARRMIATALNQEFGTPSLARARTARRTWAHARDTNAPAAEMLRQAVLLLDCRRALARRK